LTTTLRKANAHRIPVEVQKPEWEHGFYLHPELYGAMRGKGTQWARHPDAMRQMKSREAKFAAHAKK
jgi:hypothetical protein